MDLAEDNKPFTPNQFKTPNYLELRKQTLQRIEAKRAKSNIAENKTNSSEDHELLSFGSIEELFEWLNAPTDETK